MLVLAVKFSELPENQLYWLAGLLEGEGSFLKAHPSAPNRPSISMQSTDEDVIAKVASLMSVSYWQARPERYDRNGWKRVFAVHLRGARAVELMVLLKPLMGERRQQQIESAMEDYRPKEILISEADAIELAKCYWLEKEKVSVLSGRFGIGRTLVYYYIRKYADMAQW